MGNRNDSRGRDRSQAHAFFRAEDLLASLLASSSDAIVTKTLEGVITRWNPGAEEFYGYSAHEAIGRSITILIPEDRREQEARILESIRAGERVDLYDTERVHRDGHRVDVAVTVSPVRNGLGEIVAACSVGRDPGRHAPAARQTDRLAAIVASSDAAVFTVDAEGRITSWNPAAEHLYGYAKTRPSAARSRCSFLRIGETTSGRSSAEFSLAGRSFVWK